jgi:hypothetical protein
MPALTDKLPETMPCYWCKGEGTLPNDGKTRIALVVELPGWRDAGLAREMAVVALVVEELDRYDPQAQRRIVRYLVDRYMEGD